MQWRTRVLVSSRSRLGLETKGTKTLGLVQNFGTCLVSDEKFWDSLVSFASILLSLVSVSSWSGCVVFKNNNAKIQSFSSLKDGSRLGLVEKDTETPGLTWNSELSEVSVSSRTYKKWDSLVQKISINYFSVS